MKTLLKHNFSTNCIRSNWAPNECAELSFYLQLRYLFNHFSIIL